MPFKSGPLGLCLIVAASSFAARAGQLPSADEASIKLDGIIQALKKEAVEFNREAQDIEQSVLYPDYNRVSIYTSVKISNLLVKSISVTLDDLQPVRYDYSDRDAKALLLSDGLHRIVFASLEPGPHRIRAEYRAQFADAGANDAPIAGTVEQVFDKTQKAAELELRISRDSRISKPKIALVTWRAVASAAEEADDETPRLKTRSRRGRPR